jgi:hypothetical protein
VCATIFSAKLLIGSIALFLSKKDFCFFICFIFVLIYLDFYYFSSVLLSRMSFLVFKGGFFGIFCNSQKIYIFYLTYILDCDTIDTDCLEDNSN